MRLDIPKNSVDLNYKDHEVAEIKIAPSLYRGYETTQEDGAIPTEPLAHTQTEVDNMQVRSSVDTVSLSLLNRNVKPVG
jgi:hypothetical protein